MTHPEGGPAFGLHLLGDLNGTVSRIANDGAGIYRFMNELVNVTEMKAIGAPHLDLYSGPHAGWNGFSATVHIQTSHITAHFFDAGYTFLDIFSCKPFDTERTKMFVEMILAPTDAEWTLMPRGRNFPVHLIDKEMLRAQ